MPVSSTTSRSLGLAAPAAVIIALALGLCVYFIPMPFLHPSTVVLPEVEQSSEDPMSSKPFVPETPKWTELASAIEAVREPAPDAMVEERKDPASTPALSVPVVQLNLRYVGFIEEPHRLVGVFQIDATQYMVVEGEVLKDPNNPDRSGVKITKIERDKLTIDYHGTEMPFEIAKPTDETDLFAIPGASARVLNLTGSSPGPLGPPGRRRDPMNGRSGTPKPSPSAKPGVPRAERANNTPMSTAA